MAELRVCGQPGFKGAVEAERKATMWAKPSAGTGGRQGECPDPPPLADAPRTSEPLGPPLADALADPL